MDAKDCETWPVATASSTPTKWAKGTYHYEYDTDECVLCGAGSTVKYRVAGPRPDDPAKVYHYSQHACWGHFL